MSAFQAEDEPQAKAQSKRSTRQAGQVQAAGICWGVNRKGWGWGWRAIQGQANETLVVHLKDLEPGPASDGGFEGVIKEGNLGSSF